MRNVTEARAALRELVDDAAAGHITHIMRDGRVVAHLVPADTLVLDGEGRRLTDLVVESVCQRAIAMTAAEDPTAPMWQFELATVLAFFRHNSRAYRRVFTMVVAALWLHLGSPADMTADLVLDWLGHDARDLLGPSADLREVVHQAVAAAPEMIELLQSREKRKRVRHSTVAAPYRCLIAINHAGNSKWMVRACEQLS